MALKFRYNDTTYSLATSDKGSVNFCYQQSGTTYKVPASSTRGTSVQFAEDDNYYYKMDNSSPTLCFRKNNTNYYCAKSITSEAKVTYDIPAGTYTPSTFKSLIEKYISANGSRQVSNSFTVKVNGQSYTVSSGKYIEYRCPYETATSQLRWVAFNSSYTARPDTTFTGKGAYVVQCKATAQEFSNYANYNITVTTGINFS
jgi:hypothetical protein